MTTLTATEILNRLMAADPRPTREAPKDARGIYGLYDHLGAFRYIGATASRNETFYKRIHQRHRTGSETTSHYFSRMYNTGRMWRQRNCPVTKADGDIAKALRNAFIDRHCRAVWVPLPDHADIAALERTVIALAPAHMTAWNRRGMEAYDEPVELVDALIENLRLHSVERAALLKQRDRYLGRAAVPMTTSALPPLPKGPFRFFALDVETANQDRGSICQIGVACVRPDDTIETWVSLVDPRTSIWMFSGLHGVTAEMVAGAPTIDEVLDALDQFLSGHTVYQHSGFDRSAVHAACAALGRPEPAWDWKDSVAVARSAWPELKGAGGHGLASLKRHLGLNFEHHDAGEDARAAAEVVLLAEKVNHGHPVVPDVLDDEGVSDDLPSNSMPACGSAWRNVVGRSLLTQGNLKNSHFYLRKFISAFPEDAIDAAKLANGRMLTVDWGDGTTSTTDICGRHKFFRDRSSTRAFFARNGARPGDVVEVIAHDPHWYRLVLVRGCRDEAGSSVRC